MKIKLLAIITICLLSFMSKAQDKASVWDSVKATVSPKVASAFVDTFETPYRQPLWAQGWEDGIQISRNGLNLYALYYPGDLLSWTFYFGKYVSTGDFCKLFGTSSFIRPYAKTFGMDMKTNSLGCSNFLNIDIVYAKRKSITDNFTEWTLSNMARAGLIEGGPYPLFANNSATNVDLFLFTGNSCIWMIRNTLANPNNIASAVRLPSPINPVTNEFESDNPHLERLHGDTLLLVYEKYNDGDKRTFMYSHSYNNGYDWSTPTAITSINYNKGKIEHPHLFQDKDGDWYMYYSLNCEIYRSKQAIVGNWDSWQNQELVIAKGNSVCIGEPSLTSDGDISFAVAYANSASKDTTDAYDIDPWYLPKKKSATESKIIDSFTCKLFPIPCSNELQVNSNEQMCSVTIVDVFGQTVLKKDVNSDKANLQLHDLANGLYVLNVRYENTNRIYKIVKQ